MRFVVSVSVLTYSHLLRPRTLRNTHCTSYFMASLAVWLLNRLMTELKYAYVAQRQHQLDLEGLFSTGIGRSPRHTTRSSTFVLLSALFPMELYEFLAYIFPPSTISTPPTIIAYLSMHSIHVSIIQTHSAPFR
jgi:hypothetical protein